MEDNKKLMEVYDNINPAHYKMYPWESIEQIEKMIGTQGAYYFCLGNAMKYRARLGMKPDNPVEQDLAKEKWYLDKAAELDKKLRNE
jgi:hypothetical protein